MIRFLSTPDKGLRRLARLLVCNFRALENGYGEAEPILQALRELPIIPLADGRVVSLSSTGVFFPMEKAGTTNKKGKRNPAAGTHTWVAEMLYLQLGLSVRIVTVTQNTKTSKQGYRVPATGTLFMGFSSMPMNFDGSIERSIPDRGKVSEYLNRVDHHGISWFSLDLDFHRNRYIEYVTTLFILVIVENVMFKEHCFTCKSAWEP